jgi:hypothetical protein
MRTFEILEPALMVEDCTDTSLAKFSQRAVLRGQREVTLAWPAWAIRPAPDRTQV